MATKRKTVKQLADEAGIDVDTALLMLWEAGFEKIVSYNDSFGRREINRARRALGVATRRELQKPAYWMKLLKINETNFKDLLQTLDIQFGERSENINNKGILRLKSETRKRGIDPITGGVSLSEIEPKNIKKLSFFEWQPIGHKRELHLLNVDEVRTIHFILARELSSSPDPISPAGVRSESLLASAVFRPQTNLKGIPKYPTVETSAAALLHSLIQDHPFHNGNKRTALVSTLVFLDKNCFYPDFDQNKIFKLVLFIAQHQLVEQYRENLADREVLAIAQWFHDNCRFVEKGDRPIPYHRLRNILRTYDCQIESTGTGRISIKRTINKGSFRRPLILYTQILTPSEGKEIGQGTIKKIRKDLQLDDEYGIDSYAFYSKEPVNATEFIIHYRKTLSRLAKF